MPTNIHVLINPESSGEINTLRAIAKSLSTENSNIIETSNNIPNLLYHFYQLTMRDPSDVEYIILLSGKLGMDFLKVAVKQPFVQVLIEQHRLVTTWVGQQLPPDCEQYIKFIDVLGLLHEYITLTPFLHTEPIDRIVPMYFAPNPFTRESLESGVALQNWNKQNPLQPIPDQHDSYLMLILPGDVLNLDRTINFCSESFAYKLGLSIGSDVQTTKRHLLITNRAFTGTFYPESNPKHPIVRRFRTNVEGSTEWIPYNELTTTDLSAPAPTNLAYMAGAPLDPVSAAFLKGLTQKISAQQYTFISHNNSNDVLEAMVCAVFKYREQSSIIYSAEAINLSGLAKFCVTYALYSPAMNELQVSFTMRAYKHMQIHNMLFIHDSADNRHWLTILAASKEGRIESSVRYTSETDIINIAHAIKTKQEFLQTVRRLPLLPSFQACVNDRNYMSRQDAKNGVTTISEYLPTIPIKPTF